jgi:two-component system, chemotaxis family, protein-glutamate methylesterase/glutaminase
MIGSEKKTRVLLVDDSAFMRKVLQTIICSDPSMQIVGEACDGRQAVELAETLRPDVISMDINMPHLDGLGATEIIMSRNPRPIVIVSSDSCAGARCTLHALDLGAVDFVTKPSGAIDLDMHTVRDELTRKLKMAAKVRVVRTAARIHPQPTPDAPSPQPEPAPARPAAAEENTAGESCPVVVLAASTGGPATLMRLVPNFRKDFPAAILIALHMPASFTSQFAQQLAEASAIPVKEAVAGEALRPGLLQLCPGSHHLRVSSAGRIELDNGPRISGYRPCADVTLESAAAWAGPMTVGVVLTGMGNDGSRGVVAVKAAGGYVIAQDEASSTIFGMPQEAIRTGAVDEVLPTESMVAALEKRVLYLRGAAKVGAL